MKNDNMKVVITKWKWLPSIYQILTIVMTLLQLTRANGNCSLILSEACQCHTDQSFNMFVKCIFESNSVIGQLLQPSVIDIDIFEVTISVFMAEKLPMDFFNGINSIYSIKMKNSSLITIPEAMSQIKNASFLDFSENNIEVFNAMLIQHLPKIVTVDLRHNQINDITDTENALNNENVIENLDISHNNLTSVKRDLRLWSSVINLDLSFNKINRVPNISSCSLEIFVMTDNNIKEVENNAFLGLPNLKTLDISSNNISSLHLDSFRGLENLQNLDISMNSLTSIRDGTFSLLSRLKNLEISQNSLQTLTSKLFQGLEITLVKLSLSKNNIKFTIPDTFRNLYNLHTLDLSHNGELEDITDVVFPPHLSSIDLSSCAISHINQCHFIQLIHLDILEINHNHLLCECQIKWLYIWFTEKQVRNPLLVHKDDNDWLCINNMGLNEPINSSSPLENCSLSNPTHCYYDTITETESKHEVELDVVIDTTNEAITVAWKIYNNIYVYGFYVDVKTTDNKEIVESPLIHRDARKYKFSMELVKVNEIMLCLQVLYNGSKIINEVCQEKEVPSDFLQMITGIVAGVIFLLPCVTMLFYIIYKDNMYIKNEMKNSQLEEVTERDKMKSSESGDSADLKIAPITASAKYQINKSFHLNEESGIPSGTGATIMCVQINTKTMTA